MFTESKTVTVLPDSLMAPLKEPMVAESKALLYAACDRLGLKYWTSSANFVLVSVGEGLASLVQGAADRGIYLRDRSTEPGCAGCVRIGTGVVEHTRQCIAVLEEVLCAGR